MAGLCKQLKNYRICVIEFTWFQENLNLLKLSLLSKSGNYTSPSIWGQSEWNWGLDFTKNVVETFNLLYLALFSQ
jgi:hypothetical protein